MRALIITLASVVAAAALMVAMVQAEDEKISTTTVATFFGVDRNNDEAVKEKHRELAEEQYKKMFGEDHPMPDFSGILDEMNNPSNFTKKFREVVKKFAELFKIKPQDIGGDSSEYVSNPSPAPVTTTAPQ